MTEVATADDEFRAVVEDRRNIVRLSSDELTEATRTVFDEIIEQGEYDATTPYSEAEQSIVAQLDLSRNETEPQKRLIRYDQSYYELTAQWSGGDRASE